jgi:hypothetical protein
MNGNNSKKFAVLILLVLLAACSSSDEKQAGTSITPAAILEKFRQQDIARVSDIETYVGQALYEYINGGAEIYHQYGFIRVSTADFKVGELEIVADIYEFGESDLAFGIYSTFRPPNVAPVDIGVQGFTSETSFDYVKGKFLIRLICYDCTAEAHDILAGFAAALDKIIPGTTSKPGIFALFPKKNSVINSEKLIAQSYLGLAGIDKVYSFEYAINEGMAQLFISDDADGDKYADWAAQVNIDAGALKSIKDMPFDPGKMFMADDSYYGKILVGNKNGKLIGVVGYDINFKDFVSDWLNTFGM